MDILKSTIYEKEKSSEMKTKNILEKIKSRCILSKIFNILKMIRKIHIIKYNKIFQNKLNISFKELSEIEIEIIPCPNKFEIFIRIYNKQCEKYYHIFFNDSKEEITRHYLTEKDKVNKIRIIIDYQVESLNGLFFGCHLLNL